MTYTNYTRLPPLPSEALAHIPAVTSADNPDRYNALKHRQDYFAVVRRPTEQALTGIAREVQAIAEVHIRQGALSEEQRANLHALGGRAHELGVQGARIETEALRRYEGYPPGTPVATMGNTAGDMARERVIEGGYSAAERATGRSRPADAPHYPHASGTSRGPTPSGRARLAGVALAGYGLAQAALGREAAASTLEPSPPADETPASTPNTPEGPGASGVLASTAEAASLTGAAATLAAAASPGAAALAQGTGTAAAIGRVAAQAGRAAGPLAVVAGGAVMASQLADGDNRGATGTAVGMGGALAGAQMGAAVGAVAGPAGAVVGGFAGGVAGFVAGTEVGQRAYDALSSTRTPEQLAAAEAEVEAMERRQAENPQLPQARAGGMMARAQARQGASGSYRANAVAAAAAQAAPAGVSPSVLAQCQAAVAGMSTPVGGCQNVDPAAAHVAMAGQASGPQVGAQTR